MAGNTCGDFGGTSVKGGEGNNQLCVMPEGHPYAGLVTYRDGRVATLEGDGATFTTSDDKGKVTADTKLTGKLEGVEIGDCAGRDHDKSLSFLQTTYKGTSVSWSGKDLKEIYRILGQSEGQTGNAFFCSNREDRKRVALNNDVAHLPALHAAIEALDKDHSAFDDLHYHALMESLCAAAGVPVPKTFWDEVLDVAKSVGGMLFSVGFGFGILAPWLTRTFIERKKGPPNDGPGGGGVSLIDLVSQAYLRGQRDAQQNVQANPGDTLTPLPSGNPTTVTQLTKRSVAYKGTGAALMSSGDDEVGSPVTTPTVTAPTIQTPHIVPGTVVMPNALPAPRVVPELVPVVP